jgi:hypothetical protein
MKNGTCPGVPFSSCGVFQGFCKPARRSVAAGVATLTTLAPGDGGARRVILEIASALLAAFPASFGCPLRIFREVTFATSVFGHGDFLRG